VFPKRPIEGIVTESGWLVANLVTQRAFDCRGVGRAGLVTSDAADSDVKAVPSRPPE
jgi:hypothetical protein